MSSFFGGRPDGQTKVKMYYASFGVMYIFMSCARLGVRRVFFDKKRQAKEKEEMI